MFLLYLVIYVLVVIGLWQVFVKAGEEGWKAIIPIYNYYVVLKIVGRPGWWLILYFIPFVNIVIDIVVLWDLTKSFGKTAGFTVGLFFLPFVFIPILGFGAATYRGPSVGPAARG
ncbi:MAG: DUF5684 domain-containing protein [Acidimicrobiales bacterium]